MLKECNLVVLKLLRMLKSKVDWRKRVLMLLKILKGSFKSLKIDLGN
jgi:hypothetical protein